MTDVTDALDHSSRTVLQHQLATTWRFAEDFVLDRIDQHLALWMPTPHSVTVQRTDAGWVADWPDEEGDEPLGPPSIGWLLWHIEWWWSDILSTIGGGPQIPHQDFPWSGGTQQLATLKGRWDDVLRDDDLGRPISWVMPHPVPLGDVAGWVNFELTKNLAEVQQLMMLHATRARRTPTTGQEVVSRQVEQGSHHG